MISGGIFGSIIGGLGDLAGGAIGSLFGKDKQPAGYDKEYGEEARRMKFGQQIGRRMAMGDPTVEAYFQSKLQSDPGKVQDFINDFGADFMDYDVPVSAFGMMERGPYGEQWKPYDQTQMFGGSQLPETQLFGGGSYAEGRQRALQDRANRMAQSRSSTEDTLRRTLGRLSKPAASGGGGAGGYAYKRMDEGMF